MAKIKALYHYLWALWGAIIYRFPSRQIYVLAITGTKGKSSTAEMTSAILEAAGHKTALASTVKFKIGGETRPNLLKMSMPGRGQLQKFLRQAVRAGCEYAIIEMTSEGARQFRHRFIALDALIFTNLSPEHIESHGSYENYRAAKLAIAHELERSRKPDRAIIANGDDPEAPKFLAARVPQRLSYRLADAPAYLKETPLVGQFNYYNALAAITFARFRGVPEATIETALQHFPGVRGRMEAVAREPFRVIVDYAHTADSLRQVYEALKPSRLVCVLGGTGGGRDKWKRPAMGKLADEYCAKIFLTDEDPYDEDPRQIIAEAAEGVVDKNKLTILLDRREAIAAALRAAGTLRQAQGASNNDVVVFITGKGTDPYIMGPRGSKIPWDDARVAREELAKINA
jgi:UDP-N-acetylmuramoyl-L-alanyl-D-glutamate--2,6-diaminopimelate ligase